MRGERMPRRRSTAAHRLPPLRRRLFLLSTSCSTFSLFTAPAADDNGSFVWPPSWTSTPRSAFRPFVRVHSPAYAAPFTGRRPFCSNSTTSHVIRHLSSYSAAQPPPRWMIYSVASSQWHIHNSYRLGRMRLSLGIGRFDSLALSVAGTTACVAAQMPRPPLGPLGWTTHNSQVALAPSAIYIGSCAGTHLFVSSSPSLCVVAFRPPWGLVFVLVPLFLETYSAPSLSGPTSTSLRRTCYTHHHKSVTASRSRIYVYLKATSTLISLGSRSLFCSPGQQTLPVGDLVLIVITSLGPHQGLKDLCLLQGPRQTLISLLMVLGSVSHPAKARYYALTRTRHISDN